MALALTAVAAHEAGLAVQSGDTVTASELLKQGSGFADRAKSASQDSTPDGFDDIGADLYAASGDFGAAMDDEHDWLDNQVPSKMADAGEKIDNGRARIANAQHAARLKYVDLGGKVDDLESYEDTVKSTQAMFKTLSGGAQ